ncbi:cytochrome P450 [Punctularia strigosozonata HHB-11173 SS5]|uniref:cytochrome P450 n=1 Tax=Punctularia strigosozonata (strain HHB-11173) TaxID=741275 RepID=UPI0004417830|nr:cytochrome P450 [Punctularia strigosozonata HHB-11173 SS5]EIN09899.1 cytochrome P450 [Punctularia strigosozonata HHB-11173 SS5]
MSVAQPDGTQDAFGLITRRAAIVFVFIYALRAIVARYRRRSSIMDLIPGPESSSILAGNMLELSTTGAGSRVLDWRKEHHNNTVLKIKGPYFAGDGLFISDPTALWKIYDTNATFHRPPSMTALGEKLVGKGGIILSEGEAHYRIKRVMQPAFNASNVRALLPRFRHGALALVDAWGSLVDREEKQAAVIDVFDWLGASALDMIGLAAFGTKLGAVNKMQGGESISDLADAYKGVLDAMGAEETAASIFIRYSPAWLISILTLFPNKLMQVVVQSLSRAHDVASTLIQERLKDIQDGATSVDLEGAGNDALTMMLKANLSNDAKIRLSMNDMTAQITSILFAGHGSSAAFMSWALYQLAHDQSLQERVREEILAHTSQYDAEEDANIFSGKDMPLFDAFIKEVMRFYPVVHFNEKQAASDTVLRLSQPLTLADGRTVNEITVEKGTIVYADIVSYNYSEEVWGDDAGKFNVDRWMKEGGGPGWNPNAKLAPSVYSGLFNFIAGPKACLGWRFLILESQAMLFELIRNFKFTPYGTKPIHKRMQMVMVPAIDKNGELVVEMPLVVTRV